jgi:branched-chain amino acid transport system ATP-binding protein
LLELKEIDVTYGQAQVLHGVSIAVSREQIVCLIGANGAGKSTLLSAISGLVRPASGEIIFESQRIDRWPVDKIVRSGLIQVPEGRDIFTGLTVYQNLLLGSYSVQPRKGTSKDLDKVYAHFPILTERASQTAGTLSGGEQQMLAIGRALMARPRMLLLDEPSQGLAPLVTRTIFEIIQTIHETGTTVLLVEQNAFLALQNSSSAYVLQTGEIVLEGKANELLENDMVKDHYLGSA